MPFALDWSATSNVLQHSWITWITRGLYVGFRRIYLGTQVDDMFLITDIYRPQGNQYRATPKDLDMHVTWQANLNSRMPAGSEFFIEIGHNGNGDIEAATATNQGQTTCNPNTAIEYPEQPDGYPLEYMNVPGSGKNIWPTTPTTYSWSLQCAQIDALENWFAVPANRDAFAHVSHTL